MRRELCQVVTKGTRFDPGTINEACASYLVAITESEAGSKLAFAIVDTATGRFMIGGCEEKELCKPGLATMLEELMPAEIIFTKDRLSAETLQVSECMHHLAIPCE